MSKDKKFKKTSDFDIRISDLTAASLRCDLRA
jgi:hypothetical protein